LVHTDLNCQQDERSAGQQLPPGSAVGVPEVRRPEVVPFPLKTALETFPSEKTVMRTTRVSLIVLCALCALIPVALYSDGLGNNEVAFTGRVSSATLDGSGGGTLFVQMSTFDLRVLVNAKTQITDGGDSPMTMEDLAGLEGDHSRFVKVAGKYSSSGILATSVQVLNSTDPETFLLTGHITAIQMSDTSAVVSLLGIKLTFAQSVQITWDGATASLSDLQVGALIAATGRVVKDGPWTATEIKVISENTKHEYLRFEGTVLSYDSAKGVLVVDVAGAQKNQTTVLVTKSTKIEGDLKGGAYVRVTGVLNTDLGVTAKEVEVIPTLELKPDQRKLKVNGTAVFIVSLRVAAADAVTVNLAADPAGILELSKPSVVIAKGTRTAEFSVKALKLGTAKLTATVGPDSAAAEVVVGEVSEDENDIPGSAARISFAPDHIKMEVGETRDVVLLIKPPQKNAVDVAIAPYGTAGILKVASATAFNDGAAFMKVSVQAIAAGTASIVAVLPDALGGAKAELLVEVGVKGSDEEKKLELNFRPDHVQLKQGDSRPVQLNLSHPATEAVTIVLAQEGSALTGFPTQVTIEMGKIRTSIKVTGDQVGKSQIEATLPTKLGSARAVLDAEVKK
jgi:hypothetical protein